MRNWTVATLAIFHISWLKPWLLRGYGGSSFSEVYNSRYSRARRTIENTFGILCDQVCWKIRISLNSVHNYLRSTCNAMYAPAGFIDSECSDDTFLPGSLRTQCRRGNNGFRNIKRVRGSIIVVRKYWDKCEKWSCSHKQCKTLLKDHLVRCEILSLCFKRIIYVRSWKFGMAAPLGAEDISSETRGTCMRNIDETWVLVTQSRIRNINVFFC